MSEGERRDEEWRYTTERVEPHSLCCAECKQNLSLLAAERERREKAEERFIAARIASAITGSTLLGMSAPSTVAGIADQRNLLQLAVLSSLKMPAPERVRQAVRDMAADLQRYYDGTAGDLEPDLRAALSRGESDG